MTSRTYLIKSAGIISVVTMASSILGFIRETSLAAVFGATAQTDAYLAASVIPAILFGALSSALTTAFIPVFVGYVARDDREGASRMSRNLFNILTLVLVVFLGVGLVFARPLVRLIFPGFSGDIYFLTVRLVRIMFPVAIFSGLTGLLTGMLQAERNFTVPAVAVLPLNLVTIVSILTLGRWFGIGGVAVGAVFAFGIQFLVQLVAVLRMGFRYSFSFHLNDPGVRQMVRLMCPLLVAYAAGQAGVIVERTLASRLPEGSISALNFASRLNGLPIAIFVAALTTVFYPTLSQYSAEKNVEGFKSALTSGVKLINFIVMPLMAGLIVLRIPIVRLLFERGAFDARATQTTAVAVLFYGMGMLVSGLSVLASRAFFAAQDTRTPMVVGIFGVGVNIVLDLILVNRLAHGGLALGASLTAGFTSAVLFYLLRRSLGSIGGTGMLLSLAKTGASAVLMGIAMSVAYTGLSGILVGEGIIPAGLRLAAAAGVGFIVYLGFTYVLRVEEVRTAFDIGRKVLLKVGHSIST